MNVQPLKRGRGRPTTGGKSPDILDAALGLFAERGFHGTAIPDVAAQAKVATGTIYRHFPSKEALVNVLYRRCKEELMAALMTGLPGPAPLRDQFHRLWWNLVGFARGQPTAFAFLELHHHGAYLDADSRALEIRALVPIATFLTEARRRGETKPFRAQALMASVWGAFVGMVKAARLGYVALDDQLCSEVEATCWDAIRNHEPAAPRPDTGADPRSPSAPSAPSATKGQGERP